jgi:PAS domain S-box-containing protein
VPFWRSRIGRRLLLAILAFSSVLTLIISAIDLHLEYRVGLAAIERELDSIRTGYAAPLGENVWNLDKEQIAVQVRGIAALAGIGYVEVREVAGPSAFVISAGRRVSGAVEVRDIPLPCECGGNPQVIGVLHVEVPLDGLYLQLFQRTLVVLGSEALKILLTIGFIVFVVHRLVTGRLLKLAQTVRNYEPGASRPTTPRRVSASPDEFDELTEAFDALGDRVAADMVALQQSERRFRAVLDNAFQLIGVLTVDGTLLQANRTSLLFAGVEGETVFGKPFWETPWWAHSAEAQHKLRTAIRDAASGQFVRFETTHAAANGEIRHVDFSLKPVLDEAGGVSQLLAEGRDITERKQAEEELALLSFALGSVREAAFLIDEKGRFRFVNEESCRVLGYTREELLGLGVQNVDPDFPTDRWSEHWRELRTKRSILFEGRHRAKDGRIFPVEISANFIDYAKESYNLALVRDISDRKRVEQERAARDAAEAANNAKSAFLANMSHELRTPMSAIIGMAGLALRHADDPRIKEQIDKIDVAAKHMLQVINDILDISKIEAGRFNLTESEFKLGEVVENALSLISHGATERGLALVVDVPDTMRGLSVTGDPMRLGQILLNLAGNAVKFTEHGSIAIRCWIEEEASHHFLLRWEVTDTGIGISADQHKRLFTAFEQADGSLTRKYGGTGLGLAISKRLVQMMGGDIGVRSELGKGSTFWFTVRLGKAMPMEAKAASVSTGESAERQLKTRYSAARILMAEDEPINREVSQALLEEVGLAVDCAEDGRVVVDMAGQSRYALILMDMQMPNLNGIDATREIRRDSLNRSTPIVAMTANAFEEDRQACMAAGMDDFIIKPVDPDVLYETLLRWLERQSPLEPGDGAAMK